MTLLPFLSSKRESQRLAPALEELEAAGTRGSHGERGRGLGGGGGGGGVEPTAEALLWVAERTGFTGTRSRSPTQGSRSFREARLEPVLRGRRAPREAHRTSVAGTEVMRARGRRSREAPLETRPAAGRRTPGRFPSGPAWTSSRIPSHPNPLPATPGVLLSTPVAKVAHPPPIPSRSLNLLDVVWTQALGGLFPARGVRGQPQWTQGNGSRGPSATC